MKTTELEIDYNQEILIIQIVSFGNVSYIYVGSQELQFTDLTISMPDQSSTNLIGNIPTDEISTSISEITKKPIILSYSFPIESEYDLNRFDFVKSYLKKLFLNKK